MAEAEANVVEHDEQQNFSLQDSDQALLADHEFDQQNMSADVPEVYNFGGDVSENQGFIENEPEDSYVAVMEQHYSENDTEKPLNGVSDDDDQDLTGNDSNQEYAESVATETANAADNSHSQKKDEHENNLAGGGEKKWPGWPGESVFRMLVPAQKVGNIIGRKGEYIKKIVEETKARIKVLDGPPGSQERAVLISAKEEPDSSLPPAMDGLLKVHRRITDGLDGDTSLPAGGKVSTKLLVPASQAGSLIGKQGSTVKSIQETASCIVRVLGQEDVPAFALQDDRVVEVAGDPANVHSALELIASHLRKFLVDRTIIPIFEKQMQASSAPMEHMPPQPWGPSHGPPPSAGVGHGYGPGPQYMPPQPRQYENYYPPANMPPPDRQGHQGISSYGRGPPMGVHASSNTQPAQSIVAQVTQHMQIPLLYADAVIGTNGATISYIRRASGATVTIQESRGAPGDMTVEINGTSLQVQAAQQLIQNFMAEAAAAAAAGGGPVAAQTSGSTEQGYSTQGYNSYAAPTSMYGSPPSATGYASQPGAYGYGAGYGY